MKIKTKVWLEKNGQLIFGSGKASILKSIEETGSINKAAQKMKMSYRHAWSYIKEIEKRLNINLIIRIKGGKGGGGAQLTSYAKELLEKYTKIKNEIEKFADKRVKEEFA